MNSATQIDHPPVTVRLLNHAAVMIEAGDVSLLSDPWFEGGCFREEWGLRHENPRALDEAARATHLWVSHPHSDHYHPPTLKKLSARRPDLEVLANDSFNFSMSRPLQKAGFENITAFPECKTVELGEGFRVTRFPSTGIDNMLSVEIGGLRILNFNDCNLPTAAVRRLLRRIGAVDLLLINFNHASKLLPCPPDDEIRADLVRRFHSLVEAISPRWVLPFASDHYYRAPSMARQNASMLSPSELARTHAGVLPIQMGDALHLEAGSEPRVESLSPPIAPAPLELREVGESVDWGKLCEAGELFAAKLDHEFSGLGRVLGRLIVHVTDHRRVLAIDPAKRHVGEVNVSPKDAHIRVHSDSLWDWFTSPFGTDTFLVGGDFDVLGDASKPLRRMLLAGALKENGLSPRRILKMVRTASGLRFLWNRREEIVWTVLTGSFRVGDRGDRGNRERDAAPRLDPSPNALRA